MAAISKSRSISRRALEARDGLVHRRLRHVDVAEVVVGVDEIRVEGDRLLEGLARLVVAGQAGQR